MESKEPKSDQSLPDFPEYPEAPLSAWKHSGITKYVGDKVIQELERVQYQGDMVGLNVGYVLEDESTYSMSFGRTEIPETTSKDENPEKELPLSDEFLIDLYKTINELIAANVPGYLGKLSSVLTIVMTGSYTSISIICRTPQSCTLRHTGTRWCKSVNRGTWVCLHTRCP